MLQEAERAESPQGALNKKAINPRVVDSGGRISQEMWITSTPFPLLLTKRDGLYDNIHCLSTDHWLMHGELYSVIESGEVQKGTEWQILPSTPIIIVSLTMSGRVLSDVDILWAGFSLLVFIQILMKHQQK